MISGKCPKCDTVVRNAHFDEVDVSRGVAGPTYRGYTILCPKCKTILGAGFDPIALKADTVAEILRALGVDPAKGRRR
jgi:phage FluMu protein Com